MAKPRVTASGASARSFSLLAGSLCSPTQRLAIRGRSRAATKLAAPKRACSQAKYWRERVPRERDLRNYATRASV